MDGHEKPQLGGIADDTFIADIIDVGVLIGGMELNALQSHIPDSSELALVVRGIRVDTAEADDGKAVLVRLLMGDGAGKFIDVVELGGLRHDGKHHRMGDPSLLHRVLQILQGTVCIGHHPAHLLQVADRPVCHCVRKYMCVKINNHCENPPVNP